MKTKISQLIFFIFTSIIYSQSNKLNIAAELISIDVNDKRVTHIEMVKAKYKILNVLGGTYDKDTISFYAYPPSIPKEKRVQLYLSQDKNGEYSFLMSSKLSTKEQTKFYVFVGEKISLERFTPNLPEGRIIRDLAFKAKYKIIQSVYGAYPSETIEFEVYDHYGKPKFSFFNHVLLYVREGKDGKLYHEKYQYSPVYKTINDRWAGAYDDEYSHAYNSKTTIKPEQIEFLEEVTYSIKNYDKEEINKIFPDPYFKIDTYKSKAIAVMGNYVEELVKLKFNGVLKARGFINFLEN